MTEVDFANKKRLYVVVHGALCLYLTLHNIITPIVKNIGLGLDLFYNVHYWFLFHIIFLIVSVKAIKNKKIASFVAIFFWANLSITFVKSFGLLLHLNAQVWKNNFSEIIAIISNYVFTGIFFTQFTELFHSKFKFKIQHYVSIVFLVWLISLSPWELSTYSDKRRDDSYDFQRTGTFDTKQDDAKRSLSRAVLMDTISLDTNGFEQSGLLVPGRKLKISYTGKQMALVKLFHWSGNQFRPIMTKPLQEDGGFKLAEKNLKANELYMLRVTNHLDWQPLYFVTSDKVNWSKFKDL